MQTVYRKITEQLGRKLLEQETVYIRHMIEKLDMKQFTNWDTETVTRVVSQALVKKLNNLYHNSKLKDQPIYNQGILKKDYDMHEYMKSEIGYRPDEEVIANSGSVAIQLAIDKVFGMVEPRELQLAFNPETLYQKHYIVLDSRYRLLTTNGTSVFRWQYIDNVNSRQGTVNTVGTIRNLVGMKLYQPVFPNKSLNSMTQRLSILIEEFAAQSFIASAERRYHFITRTTPTSNGKYVECQTEDFNDGVYKFHTPVTTFDTLTVTFGDPLDIISLSYDRANVTFSYGLTTTVTCPIAHNLASGDRVFLSDFTTDAPAVDKIYIDAVNDKFGLAVTVTSPTAFTLPVNTSTITPTAGLTIECYFAAFRFILAFEMTSLREDNLIQNHESMW